MITVSSMGLLFGNYWLDQEIHSNLVVPIKPVITRQAEVVNLRFLVDGYNDHSGDNPDNERHYHQTEYSVGGYHHGRILNPLVTTSIKVEYMRGTIIAPGTIHS